MASNEHRKLMSITSAQARRGAGHEISEEGSNARAEPRLLIPLSMGIEAFQIHHVSHVWPLPRVA